MRVGPTRASCIPQGETDGQMRDQRARSAKTPGAADGATPEDRDNSRRRTGGAAVGIWELSSAAAPHHAPELRNPASPAPSGPERWSAREPGVQAPDGDQARWSGETRRSERKELRPWGASPQFGGPWSAGSRLRSSNR